jgi:hypothetical protein
VSGSDVSGRDVSGSDVSGTDVSGSEVSGSNGSASDDSGADESGVELDDRRGGGGSSGNVGSVTDGSGSTSVVSTRSVVSTVSVVSGALVAGSDGSGAVSGVVTTAIVDADTANSASISSGVDADVVGVVVTAIVAIVGTVSDGVVVVDAEGGLGGSSVLSVPSEPPPVVNTRTKMAKATMAKAAATQTIEPGSFHHRPVGSSYSQATSGDSSPAPAGGEPPAWRLQSPLLRLVTT